MLSIVSPSSIMARPWWIKRWLAACGRKGILSQILSLSCFTVVVTGRASNSMGKFTPGEGDRTRRLTVISLGEVSREPAFGCDAIMKRLRDARALRVALWRQDTSTELYNNM